MQKLYYLATPYSKFHLGIQEAARQACEQAALLTKANITVFCPIAHSHFISVDGGIDPFDNVLWLEHDKPFMDRCDGLIVCMMQGWDQSYGVGVEIKTFERAGKPITYMVPGEVPLELIPKKRPPRRVVGLCGYATSGKDESARALTSIGWTRVSFADAVRRGYLGLDPFIRDERSGFSASIRVSQYLELCSWQWDLAKKHPDIREGLQRYGTEAGRDIHGQNCWVDIARSLIDEAPGDVVITDVRFQNEGRLLQDLDGRLFRVEKPGVGPVNRHTSDAGINALRPHLTIHNETTVADLHRLVRSAVQAMWPNEPVESRHLQDQCRSAAA